jgi:hypothetical protein
LTIPDAIGQENSRKNQPEGSQITTEVLQEILNVILSGFDVERLGWRNITQGYYPGFGFGRLG